MYEETLQWLLQQARNGRLIIRGHINEHAPADDAVLYFYFFCHPYEATLTGAAMYSPETGLVLQPAWRGIEGEEGDLRHLSTFLKGRVTETKELVVVRLTTRHGQISGTLDPSDYRLTFHLGSVLQRAYREIGSGNREKAKSAEALSHKLMGTARYLLAQ